MACPICDRETDRAYRPFCSRRCADIDLSKWLTGSYAVPSEEDEVSSDQLPDDQSDALDRPH